MQDLPSFSTITVYEQTLNALIAQTRADLEVARSQLAPLDVLEYLDYQLLALERKRRA